MIAWVINAVVIVGFIIGGLVVLAVMHRPLFQGRLRWFQGVGLLLADALVIAAVVRVGFAYGWW